MSMNRNDLTASLASSANAIKGIAIIGIVYYHYFRSLFSVDFNIQWQYHSSFFHHFIGKLIEKPEDFLVLILYYFGYLGVTAFFILSGWGLAHSSLRRKEGKISYAAFCTRRLKRVIPLYWMSLVFFFFFFSFPLESIAKEASIFLHLLFKAAFFHNYSPDTIFSLNSSYWFVGTLMILYLLFPLLLGAMKNAPGKTILFSLFVSYFITIGIQHSPLERIHTFLAMGGFPLTKLGEFAMGIFIAIYAHENAARANAVFRHPLSALCAALALVLGVLGFKYEALYPFHPLLIVTPLIFVMLHASLFFRAMSGRIHTVFSFVGLYSYAIFLFHRPFAGLWIEWIGAFQRAQVFLFATLFLLFSILLSVVLEKAARKTFVPAAYRIIDKIFAMRDM